MGLLIRKVPARRQLNQTTVHDSNTRRLVFHVQAKLYWQPQRVPDEELAAARAMGLRDEAIDYHVFVTEFER